MATVTDTWRDRFRPRPETVYWAGLLLSLELVALLTYVIFVQPLYGARFNSLWGWRLAIYPLIWINVGLWAVWRTTPAQTTDRRKLIAAAIAAGYFVVVAYVSGLFGLTTTRALGLSVGLALPPGFSPAVLYHGDLIRLTLFPFEVFGYLALSYLLYATVIDAAGSAVTGLLGLLSCVSCTWPIAASLLSGILGGATGAAAAATGNAYGLSTAVFVITVLLLYWRPTV
jgi:hypothetical protein